MPGASHISVVIPAYNAERTIGATLESVFAQRTPPLEVLVMDDGSTDRTANIVQAFGNWVRLLRQPNRGLAAARNALFAAARGRWIALLDADDLWQPGYLDLQVAATERFPQAVASFTAYTDFHGAGDPPAWPRPLQQPPPATPRLIDGADFIERYFEASAIALPSFSLLCGAWLKGLGQTPVPDDLSGAEDTFLWYRAALDGPVCLTASSGGYYRVLPGSLSHDRVRAYRTRVRAVRRVLSDCLDGRTARWRARVRRHLRGSGRAGAKYLAGDGQLVEAREVLRASMAFGFDLKSTLLWCLFALPRTWQPTWPARYRPAGGGP